MPDWKQTDHLKQRTKTFALRLIRLYRALPRKTEAEVIGRQMLRSGTSVAANYRAVCRSRSQAEFASRMGIVAEEADETLLWLELLVESDLLPRSRMEPLLKEANELLAIFSASRKTARG